MDRADIVKIACQAKSDFEAYKIDENELKRHYQQYNPLEDIDSFMTCARTMFPKLNCGLASLQLQTMLPDARIVHGKYREENHTFILLEDMTVVDITADQYGGPKIYVGELKPPWSLHKTLDSI